MIYRCPVCKRVGVIVKADEWITKRCFYCSYQETERRLKKWQDQRKKMNV